MSPRPGTTLSRATVTATHHRINDDADSIWKVLVAVDEDLWSPIGNHCQWLFVSVAIPPLREAVVSLGSEHMAESATALPQCHIKHLLWS